MTSLLALLLLAQAPPGELRTVFPEQATVTPNVPTGSWARLPLPDEVLRQVDRDLADVRLVDGAGRLVPFVVQRERWVEPAREVPLSLLSATRKEVPAGQGTPNVFQETSVFALPEGRAPTPRLEFSTAVPRFVRHAKLEALTDKGVVVGSMDTTLFRLPPAGEKLTVWMPAIAKEATRLRVTLSGQDDGFLTLSAEATFAERGPPETTLAWPFTGAPRTDGKATVWEVDKPGGIVPMRLSVKTSTPWVGSPGTELEFAL